MSDDPLRSLLAAVARGHFPPPDGAVVVLQPPCERDAVVLGFTAHTVIFADVDPAWVAAQLPPGDLSAPLSPAFLARLAARVGRRINGIDMLLVAGPLPGPPPVRLDPAPGSGHPRAGRARHYRDRVRVWEAESGIVILGTGLGGRWEAAVEVSPRARGKGLGRDLAAAARHLVPAGAPVWAEVTPGNAASVRAFLAAGYLPVGSEAMLLTTQPE